MEPITMHFLQSLQTYQIFMLVICGVVLVATRNTNRETRELHKRNLADRNDESLELPD